MRATDQILFLTPFPVISLRKVMKCFYSNNNDRLTQLFIELIDATFCHLCTAGLRLRILLVDGLRTLFGIVNTVRVPNLYFFLAASIIIFNLFKKKKNASISALVLFVFKFKK